MVRLGGGAGTARKAQGALLAAVALTLTGCRVDGDECIAECQLDGDTATGVAFVQDTEQGPNRTEELTLSAHGTACSQLCHDRTDGGPSGHRLPAGLTCQDRCRRQSTVEIRCQRATRPWVPPIWTGR